MCETVQSDPPGEHDHDPQRTRYSRRGNHVTSRLDKTDRYPGKGAAGAPGTGTVEDTFAGDFAKLKLKVIRPAFDALADWLKGRGNDVEISEVPDGDISIQVVPAGADRSIARDRFPAFSVLGSSYTKTIALQASNTRPGGPAAASGSRGTYTLAQINTPILEAELMKFVDEIAGWQAASISARTRAE